MNRIAGLLLAGILAAPAWAQTTAAGHDAHPASPASDTTEGEVRKVDKVGDQVRFKAAHDGGRLTVVELHPAR